MGAYEMLYADAPVTEVGNGWVDYLHANDRSWRDGGLMKSPDFYNVGWVRGIEARLMSQAFSEGRTVTVRSQDANYDWILRAELDGDVRLVSKPSGEMAFGFRGVFSEEEVFGVISALKNKSIFLGGGFRVLYAPPHTMVSRNSGASAFLQRAS